MAMVSVCKDGYWSINSVISIVSQLMVHDRWIVQPRNTCRLAAQYIIMDEGKKIVSGIRIIES